MECSHHQDGSASDKEEDGEDYVMQDQCFSPQNSSDKEVEKADYLNPLSL